MNGLTRYSRFIPASFYSSNRYVFLMQGFAMFLNLNNSLLTLAEDSDATNEIHQAVNQASLKLKCHQEEQNLAHW